MNLINVFRSRGVISSRWAKLLACKASSTSRSISSNFAIRLGSDACRMGPNSSNIACNVGRDIEPGLRAPPNQA